MKKSAALKRPAAAKRPAASKQPAAAKRPAITKHAAKRPATSASASLSKRPARDDPVSLSDWAGDNTVARTNDRQGTVWLEAVPQGSALFPALALNEEFTRVHDQPDGFITDWNEASESAWGRIRRWEVAMIPDDRAGSVVYEDASAQTVNAKVLVSCFSVQTSVEAAAAGAWHRVVGVARFDGVTFGILQEYDGEGCMVAMHGELKSVPWAARGLNFYMSCILYLFIGKCWFAGALLDK